jgi:hypothetical protein
MQSTLAPASSWADPALLAFVKCHITSFAKWDVLRGMADRVGVWVEADGLAAEIARPPNAIRAALDELEQEGILEMVGSDGARSYRLPEGEPTTVVAARLVSTVTRSQDLRQIVVAHILRAAVA